MALKPQEYFLGVIDLFVILLPGVFTVFAALSLLYNYPFAPLPELHWGAAEATTAFLLAAYVTGHGISLLGSKAEDAAYSVLGDAGRREHQALREHARGFIPVYFPAATEGTLRRRVALFVRSKSERDATLLDRKDADRRFFRNFTAAALISCLFSIGMQQAGESLFFLVVAAISVARYLDQQGKYSRDVLERFANLTSSTSGEAPVAGTEPHQEVELKMGVPDAESLRAVELAAGGHPLHSTEQVNHYFDTLDHDLDRAKFLLRLRTEAGDHILTVKAPETRSLNGSLVEREEAELKVDADLGRRILEGAVYPLEPFLAAPEHRSLAGRVQQIVGTKPIRRVGQISNHRRRCKAELPVEVGVVLELDTMTLPDGTEAYEVEIELPRGQSPSRVKDAVDALFAKAKVLPQPTSSKAARFFESFGRESSAGSLESRSSA